MTIYEKLASIQQELVAPKGQKNTFGNYNYRSCEDIEHAVKPLLKKYNATIVMDGGEMKCIGDRYYMTCKVVFVDLETGEQYMTSATVREDDNRKGMTSEQLSGSQISYCRKYCLAGLFLIDNEKDPDTDAFTKKRKEAEEEEKHQDEVEFVQNAKIPKVKIDVLKKLCETDNVSLVKVCEAYKIASVEDMTEKMFQNLNAHWGKVKESCHA